MTVESKFLIPSPQSPARKQLKMKQTAQNAQSEYKIHVYNYFLDDFPKTYMLSPNDTIANLKEKIVKDTQIRYMDIKNFKDERAKFVNEKQVLSRLYSSNSNLNMEIYFNQDLKITVNNKRIACFMFDYSSDNAQIYEQIMSYHKSEKGGKIIVGVQSTDGLIKGINIPDQDSFKKDFVYHFEKMNGFRNSLLKNVDISFFRVKGQNKHTYNFNDHKKIMIIKIKGTNQQDLSNESTDDDDETKTIINPIVSDSEDKFSQASSNSNDFEDKIQSILESDNQNRFSNNINNKEDVQLQHQSCAYKLFEYNQSSINQILDNLVQWGF